MYLSDRSYCLKLYIDYRDTGIDLFIFCACSFGTLICLFVVSFLFCFFPVCLFVWLVNWLVTYSVNLDDAHFVYPASAIFVDVSFQVVQMFQLYHYEVR